MCVEKIKNAGLYDEIFEKTMSWKKVLKKWKWHVTFM